MALRLLARQTRCVKRPIQEVFSASSTPAVFLASEAFAQTSDRVQEFSPNRAEPNPGHVQQWPLLINRTQYAQSALQEAEDEPTPKRKRKTYQIKVETGDVRGAGTKAPAVLCLYGELGSSSELTMGTGEDDKGFERGSTQTYELDDEDLGTIRRCYIRQELPDEDESIHGWFLNQVTVTDSDGQTWPFPCNSWIGDSDADGYAAGRERNLILCDNPELHTQDQPILPQPLKVTFGAVSVPHPEKVSKENTKAVNRKSEGWGGEDAYFCNNGRYGIVGMGVADGVYAWKERGIDAGLFSRTLMSTAGREVNSGTDDVVKLMEATVAQTYADNVQGSSTACLVLIDTLHGRLTSANIGDSGFMVLGTSRQDQHEMELKYHSPQQEHQFGFPYQLGHHEGADAVDAAMLHTLPVTSGDVIVLGSDGLWDNVSVHEISEIVKAKTATGCRPSVIAQHLAKVAFEHGLDKHGMTPYSQAASEAFDMIYSGGKQDDITVVVTQLE